MTTLKITLTEAGRLANLKAGFSGQESQVVDVTDVAALEAACRAAKVTLHVEKDGTLSIRPWEPDGYGGNTGYQFVSEAKDEQGVLGELNTKAIKIAAETAEREAKKAKERVTVISEVLAVEDLRKLLREHEEGISLDTHYRGTEIPWEEAPELADKLAAVRAEQAAWTAEKAEAAVTYKTKAVAAEAEARRFQAEKKTWIAEHGSSRLQKAVAVGYPAQRGYVAERAEWEFPGVPVVIDWDGKAEWVERSYPTEEGLDLLAEIKNKHLNAQIVWLTDDGQERDRVVDEDYDDFIPYEALVIEGYLGEYTLILRISYAFHVKEAR